MESFLNHSFISISVGNILKTGQLADVAQLLTRLKKICNHPDLVEPRQAELSYREEAIRLSAPARIHGMCRRPSVSHLRLGFESCGFEFIINAVAVWKLGCCLPYILLVNINFFTYFPLS